MSWKRNLTPSTGSNLKFDQVTGEIEITQSGKVYKGQIGLVESQRDFILDCIDSGVAPNIENARFDVAVYDFMLNADQPLNLIRQYFDKKHELKTSSKREIAKALGWLIDPNF